MKIIFNLDGILYITEKSEYFRKCERECVKKEGVCDEGVKELVSILMNEGNKLYIYSSGSQEYIDLVTETLGMDQFFEKKYSSRDYTCKADIIKEIKKGEESVVIVGDTVTDYNSAKQFRLPFIFCRYGYGTEDAWDDIYFAADKPIEILAVIHKCRLFENIKKKLQGGQKRIIGVNGVDTSGKTYFSNELSTYLRAVGINNTVIHIDDFHNTRAVRNIGENEIDAYYNHAFNYDQLLSEVLVPLKQYGQLHKTVRCLDLDTDQYINDITFAISKDTVVILEGVLLFREPLLPYFDMKIYIDINFDEVLRRAQIRDIPKYGAEFIN